MAELALTGPTGDGTVDARPSDAINLALITGAAITVDAGLFDAQAFPPDPAADTGDYPEDAQAIRDDILALHAAATDERLTAAALQVLDLARAKAIDLSSGMVGSEHLLLALAEDPQRFG